MIRRLDDALFIEPKKADLIAPEGFEYKSKIFDTVIGNEIFFETRVYIKGVKLDAPYTETESDFELVEIKKEITENGESNNSTIQ